MWKNVVAPTILVIVFWVFSSIATAYYIRSLEKDIRSLETVPARMIQDDLTTITAADQMRFQLGVVFRTVIDAPHPITPEKAAEITLAEGTFRKHFDAAVASATSDDEIGVDKQIKILFDGFCSEVQRQIDHPPTSPDEKLENFRRLMRITGQVSTLANRLGEINARLMKELANTGSASTRSSTLAHSTNALTVIRYGLLIVGPALGILCGFWISQRFHRSISQISITLNDVASEMREHVGRVDVRQSGGLPLLQEQVGIVLKRIREVVQQLNEARRQAISGARLAALGEMAAGVAHELRNPLTSVKLLIQTSAQRSGRQLTDKQFQVVLEEISRMETTIERMLDFARPTTVNRKRHDLREIVTRALSLVEGRAHHAAVGLQSEIPENPVEVSADAEQLHQVFSNLLQNAIEAMPTGGLLKVTIDPGSAGRNCRVTVADTGPGITADVMARIFEPFVTDKARGTGLGLAVSHRIVCDHEGRLIAENGSPSGAVFTVELPLFGAPAIASRDPIAATVSASGYSTLTTDTANAEVAHH